MFPTGVLLVNLRFLRHNGILKANSISFGVWMLAQSKVVLQNPGRQKAEHYWGIVHYWDVHIIYQGWRSHSFILVPLTNTSWTTSTVCLEPRVTSLRRPRHTWPSIKCLVQGLLLRWVFQETSNREVYQVRLGFMRGVPRTFWGAQIESVPSVRLERSSTNREVYLPKPFFTEEEKVCSVRTRGLWAQSFCWAGKST